MFITMSSGPLTQISYVLQFVCDKESNILICPMNGFLLMNYFPHCLFNVGENKKIFSSEGIKLFPYNSKYNFESFVSYLYIWSVINLNYLGKIKTHEKLIISPSMITISHCLI